MNNNRYTTTSKSHLISNLVSLVKAGEKSLTSGGLPLCLTPEILQILNEGFDTITDLRAGEHQQLHSDLTYLVHIFNQTKYLKLTHGGSATLQAPVDLSVFTQLEILHVKRIPPHWIKGLQKLQLRLTQVKCTRCLNYLDDMLAPARSGESGLTWSRLRKLFLPNNFIKEIDESLELLPTLEVLDLSQNYITETSDRLSSLTELSHVNLAYNSINKIPTFSHNTQLTTLVLRANHIDQINGLELLDNLQVLDLSHNILCDHYNLYLLNTLHKLAQLFLAGNPLSCNCKHRIITASLFQPIHAPNIYLDEVKFTATELKCAMEERTSGRMYRPPPDGSSQPNTGLNSPNPSRITSRTRNSVITTIADIEYPYTTETELEPDVQSFENVSISTISPESPSKHLPTKTLIEIKREQFGADWLSSLNNSTASNLESSNTSAISDYKPLQTPVNNSLTNINQQVHNHVTDLATSDVEVIDESTDVERQSSYEFNYGSAEEPSSLSGRADQLLPHTGAGSAGSVKTQSEESESESIYSCEPDSDDQVIGDWECDPFIVKSFTSIDTEEYIVRLTDHHLIETDIHNELIDKLELSALQTAIQLEENGEFIVKLKLDYFRKDRRERAYIMEDEKHCEKFLNLLQPVLDKRQKLNQKSIETMECLKCGKQFRVPPSHARSATVCAYCNSDMIVELGRDAFSSTPFGSANSGVTQGEGGESRNTSLYQTALNNISISIDQTASSNISISIDQSDISTPRRNPSHTSLTLLKPDNDESAVYGSDQEVLSDTDDSLGSIDDDAVSDDEDAIYRRGQNRMIAEDAISYASMNDSDCSVDPNSPDIISYRDRMTSFRFNRDDLSYIDHRLKLHLSMTYIEEGEELVCVVRLKCVTLSRPEEYPALFILSNKFLYLFRLHHTTTRADLSTVLELEQRDLLSNIYYIEIGLFHHNIRLEFDKIGFCLLLRDGALGKMLHAKLAELMSLESSESSKLESITKINQEYYTHISKTISQSNHSKAPTDQSEHSEQSVVLFDESSMRYCTGFLVNDQSEQSTVDTELLIGCTPVSIVLDNNNLYLMRELYHIPITRNRQNSSQDYFILEKTVALIDISTLKVDRSICELSIIGFDDEHTPLSHIRFVSPGSMSNFIKTLRVPWQEKWGVELQVYMFGSGTGQ